MTTTAETVETFVKIGAEMFPMGAAAVHVVLAFAHAIGGNEETIKQLEANQLVIDADRKMIADELAELDATEPKPPQP